MEQHRAGGELGLALLIEGGGAGGTKGHIQWVQGFIWQADVRVSSIVAYV